MAAALVGRHGELAQLERALADASTGRGRLALLAGEPGIGKSRLADEAASRAAATMRVVWGRAWEAGGAPPFWPWIQVLRALRRDLPETRIPPEIGRLVPEVGSVGATLRATPDDRFELFDAIYRYACAAATSRPLLLVLEDLHAADVASLQLLAFFAAHLPGSAIAIVGTYRTSEARTTPEVGAWIARLGRDAETIVPRRLSRDDVAALAAEAGVTAPATIDAIVRASEGNPLFTRELIKLADRTGVLSVPDSVRDAIRERLRRLGTATRALADCAAVIGSELPRPMLAALSGLGDRELGAELAILVDHGVLVEGGPGRHAFAHGLFAETLHHDLEPGRRVELHARAAGLIGSLPGASTAQLTRHLFEAGPAHTEAAIEAARRAASEAARQLAFAEAAAMLVRAVAVTPVLDHELRYELLVALGTMEIHAGDGRAGRATCLRAAEIARALGDGHKLARAAVTYGLQLTLGLTDPVLLELLEEALRALPAGDSAERARLLARLASAHQPCARPAGPMASARDAIAMARRLGDERVLLEVLYAAISALMNFAPPRERLALNLEVLELATRAGDRPVQMRTHYRLLVDHLSLGDVSAATGEHLAFQRASRDLRQPHLRALAAQMRGLFALHAGRLAEHAAELIEAERLLTESDDHPTLIFGFRMVSLFALADDATLAAERARFAGFLRGGFRLYEAVGNPFVDAITGDLECARVGAARLDVRELLEFHDPINLSWAAELGVRLGDRALAEVLYEGLLPDRELWCGTGLPAFSIEPSMERVLGMLAALLGRCQEARGHFQIVLGQLRGAGLPVLLARTLVQWADTAPAVASLDEAHAALAEARELATAFGLPVIARINACERRLASPVRPSPSPAPAAAGLPAVLAVERHGDLWLFARGTASGRVKHSRGVELLARMIAEPARELHVLDLVGAEGTDGGDAGEVLDREAIAAYRDRVIELRMELADAEARNDSGRQARAKHELEMLEDQLVAGVARGGKPRRAGGATERARVNVQRRVVDAIKRIAEVSPELGRHFEATVRTGTYCSYDPRRAEPTAGRPR